MPKYKGVKEVDCDYEFHLASFCSILSNCIGSQSFENDNFMRVLKDLFFMISWRGLLNLADKETFRFPENKVVPFRLTLVSSLQPERRVELLSSSQRRIHCLGYCLLTHHA